MPDRVIAIAETRELLHQLDAAFLQVGEACGGLLVKFHGGEPEATDDELKADMEAKGRDASRLEKEGCRRA